MARRYLGVDYGSQRIGLAIADEVVLVARPWQVIEVGQSSAPKLVADLARAEQVTDLVVGLPRSLDGQDTAQTAEVRRFAKELESTGLPIILQDEADTSHLAKQRNPDKHRIDAEAAAIILQDYLENQ